METDPLSPSLPQDKRPRAVAAMAANTSRAAGTDLRHVLPLEEERSSEAVLELPEDQLSGSRLGEDSYSEEEDDMSSYLSDFDGLCDLVAVVSDSGATSDSEAVLSDDDQSAPGMESDDQSAPGSETVVTDDDQSAPGSQFDDQSAPGSETDDLSQQLHMAAVIASELREEQCASPFMGCLASDASPPDWQEGEHQLSPDRGARAIEVETAEETNRETRCHRVYSFSRRRSVGSRSDFAAESPDQSSPALDEGTGSQRVPCRQGSVGNSSVTDGECLTGDLVSHADVAQIAENSVSHVNCTELCDNVEVAGEVVSSFDERKTDDVMDTDSADGMDTADNGVTSADKTETVDKCDMVDNIISPADKIVTADNEVITADKANVAAVSESANGGVGPATVGSTDSSLSSISSAQKVGDCSSLAKPSEEVPKQSQHEIQRKLRNFTVITDNIWRQRQKLSRHQKEVRHMVCDCCLSSEEQARGERGCGEDCLNRLLMIECGSRCPLGDSCSNKRFMKKEYNPTSVFKTEMKGYGLRAEVEMPAGAFIYEYVGEVLDAREFRRRTKQYDRLNYHHHYFMALSADLVIDATEKGNDSRFINHSCDPNSETQKWTVNGQLRIGFFTRRAVAPGEELTFDYQLQRYGREAQRCFCGSSICRGWITDRRDDAHTDQDDSSDEEDEEEEEEEEDEASSSEDEDRSSARANRQSRDSRRQSRKEERVRRRQAAERKELENDIKKLTKSGLKSKQHTLQLCRLMVRAEADTSRLSLLSLIRSADSPCRRLFLDYHGLSLLWSWMTIGPSSAGAGPAEVDVFRRELLETLSALPIPNRSVLSDSRVLTTVQRWANKQEPDGESEVVTMSKNLLETWSSLKEVFRIPKKERIEMMRAHEKEADRGYQTYLQQNVRPVTTPAHKKKLYDCSLDVFRLKRQRNLPASSASSTASPDESSSCSRRPLPGTPTASEPALSKEERRHRFMLAVQKQDQEQEQREQQLQLWGGHQQRCQLLGLDPHHTPIFDPSYQYYWEPGTSSWQPYTPGDPAVPLVPAPGVDAARIDALPHHLTIYQSMAATDPAQAQLYLEQLSEKHKQLEEQKKLEEQQKQLEEQQKQQKQLEEQQKQLEEERQRAVQAAEESNSPEESMGLMELLQSQLPGKFVTDDGRELSLLQAATAAAFEEFNSYCSGSGSAVNSDMDEVQPSDEDTPGFDLASYTDPAQPNITITNVVVPNGRPSSRKFSPPPPPELVIKLPPDWRLSRDAEGRFYYYHQVTRISQWEPPVFPDSTTSNDPTITTVEEVFTTRSSSSSSGSSSCGGAGVRNPPKRPPPTGNDVGRMDSSSDEEAPTHRYKKRAVLRADGMETDELEEGEIREDIAKDEEVDRRRMKDIRRRRKRSKRRSALVQEYIISPVQEHTDRRVLREERRRQKRQALLDRRRERQLDRLLQKHRSQHRRQQEQVPPSGSAEPPSDPHTSPAVAAADSADTPHERPSAVSSATPEPHSPSAVVPAQPTPEPQPADTEQRDEAIRRFKVREKKLSRLKQREQVKMRHAARLRRKREIQLKRAMKHSAAESSSSQRKPAAPGKEAEGEESKRKRHKQSRAKQHAAGGEKKAKDRFLAHMSLFIVSVLNAFRKPDCKHGKITSTEDFKYLAKKLTHHVMIKELKSVENAQSLQVNDSVKHKAKYYVKKYMNRLGPQFVRSGSGAAAGPSMDPGNDSELED